MMRDDAPAYHIHIATNVGDVSESYAGLFTTLTFFLGHFHLSYYSFYKNGPGVFMAQL